ncbi:hypothetical protein DNH61_25185 [Paenibacillus sambharensis]|uniref:Aspartate aminotransferase family protein n=1 Tax=Paenibacillus sambharensis TaxID=1803190 RepID=A0A2W1L135_9BACL|nr:aminotransferase class III-fold pyridoxal phosphate-dependent enzyme [Paenibacillus sambharensis]PZD93076.1 hypothetical protein DNH61_25185 [Paenibacillus sambharensis]
MIDNPIIHPFLASKDEHILTNILKAERIYVYDSDGKQYIDAMGGLWNMILGYQNEEVITSIYEQMRMVPFINMWCSTNETTIRLANRLLSAAGGNFNKVMFTCSGSESIELAIKLIRKYHYDKGNRQKKYIAVFDSSYHGGYYGSLTATGLERGHFEPLGPMLQGFIYLPVPFTRKDRHSLLEHLLFLEHFFEENGHRLGGIIVEPVLGSAGVIPIPEQYFQRMQVLCLKHDVILALDEVSTGLYRTGPLFNYQSYRGLEPDLLCLSKGLSGGYLPLGTVLLSKKISVVIEHEAFAHLSTQNGNPACCMAALKVLDILERGNYETVVKEKSIYFRSKLKILEQQFPIITDIRIHGLMIAIEIKKQSETLRFEEVWEMMLVLKHKGLLVYPFSSKYSAGLMIMPPYIIEYQEVDHIIDILVQFFGELVNIGDG